MYVNRTINLFACGLVVCALVLWPCRDSVADGGPEATCTPGYDGPPEALFPTFADADTVLLRTFDDPEYPNATLTDASGNEYDLRLMDGGDLAPGVYGTARQFALMYGSPELSQDIEMLSQSLYSDVSETIDFRRLEHELVAARQKHERDSKQREHTALPPLNP